VRGKEVAVEGEVGHALHVILSGRATVSHDGRTVRRLGPGDYFGDISMIDGMPRSATVRIDEDVRALAVGHMVFETLLDERPEFARVLLKRLCARLREAEARAEARTEERAESASDA
jgi:CRP-like cAMP-binding protein